MQPQRIQLAIQGGGAKICALMAAIDAVESLQAEGLIKVTRVAGTSAGAIVGCVFAAGIPMQEIRRVLRSEAGSALVSRFSLPRAVPMAYRALRGRPFWNSAFLRNELDKLFQSKNVTTLEDLERVARVPVIVIAADLRDRKKHIHRGDTSIVSALLDSAGLPFCFRTWSSQDGPVLVDGGICENLPTDDLAPYAQEDGPVVAITFTRSSGAAPTTFKTFALALLDTAISNSMNRARSAVEAQSLCELSTTIGTFDFERALNEGLDDAQYGNVKGQAEKFFRGFVARKRKEQQNVDGDPWAETNPTAVRVMNGIGLAYEAQHAKSMVPYSSCTFVIKANSLLGDNEPGYGYPDTLKYTATFEPTGEPLYCISVALSVPPDGTYLGRTNVSVRNEKKQVVPVLQVPMRSDKTPRKRELLLCFTPPLKPGTGSYTLTFTDEAPAIMKPLQDNGRDDLVFWPRRAKGKVGRIDLVLQVPERFRSTSMASKSTGEWGRAMTPEELTMYDPDTYGFRSIGWTGHDLDANGERVFGIDVFLGSHS